MSKGHNRFELIGNLGKDGVELRHTQKGIAKATFNLAVTTEEYKNGEWVAVTDWINFITAWGKLAEVCGEYLHKGSRVRVEGKIKPRDYTHKTTGEKRYFTQYVVSDLLMLDSMQEPQQRGEIADDDIPF